MRCLTLQGLDAMGLRRRDLVQVGPNRTINFNSVPHGIPATNVRNIEFKVAFHVPTDPSKSAYNHLLPLTDYIVCSDLFIGEHGTPLPFELPDDLPKHVRDDHGHVGEICLEYVDEQEGRITIPPLLKGYAFIITDIRDAQGQIAKQPPQRSIGHNAIFVVELKGLLAATFNNIKPVTTRAVFHAGAVEAPPPSTTRKRRTRSAGSTQPSQPANLSDGAGPSRRTRSLVV